MGFFDHIPDEQPADTSNALPMDASSAPEGRGFFDHIPDDTEPVPETPAPEEGDKGWLDYATRLSQKVASGVTARYADEAAAFMGSGFGLGSTVGLNNYRDILESERAKEKGFEKSHPKTALAAELGGALATGAGGTRFILNAPSWGLRALRSGAVAAPFGALNETGGLEKPKDKDLTFGDYAGAAGSGALKSAVAGGLLSTAGSAVGATVGPWASAAAQRLSDRGISLTPGELLGGNAKRLEDTLTAVPFLNRFVRNRQMEGTDTLNREAINTVMRGINEGVGVRLHTPNAELPAGIDSGYAAVQHAHDVVQQAYAQAIPGLRARIDTGMRTDIAQIRSGLPDSVRGLFDDAIRRRLTNSADATGGMAGRDVQNALQGLRNEGRRLQTAQGGTAYDHDLGEALLNVRTLLRNNVNTRSAPGVVRKFSNTDAAFARLVRIEKAAKSVAAEGGTFTPAMLHRAITSSDMSARGNAVSRGQALMQDLSSDAKTVMSRKINDSGTPERAAIAGAIGGAGLMVPKGSLAALGALMGLYSHAGNRAFQGMATASPQARMMLRRAIERATAAGAPGIAEQMGN